MSYICKMTYVSTPEWRINRAINEIITIITLTQGHKIFAHFMLVQYLLANRQFQHEVIMFVDLLAINKETCARAVTLHIRTLLLQKLTKKEILTHRKQ